MSVAGKWRLTVNTPVGEQHVNLDLKTDGATLNGTVTDDGTLKTEIFDGTVDGNQLSFKIRMTRPVPTTLKFTGTHGGDDTLEGKVKMAFFGNRPATAVRV